MRKKDSRFHFKKFSVRHDRSGMKVGTDGVLLGAWADVSQATRILDIGTGTGVIALMLAQQTNPDVKIEAIEIDENAFEDASENFSNSPWHDRLTLHHGSVQNFTTPKQYDLIISNPPFFQRSFKPPNAQRISARHTENLSFQDLLKSVDRFLSEKGKLNIVLPYAEGIQFVKFADHVNLYCSRNYNFRTRKEKPIERSLLEFSKIRKELEEGEILLYNDMGEAWSTEYQKLTQNFYLKI